jgi:hypothetical protein
MIGFSQVSNGLSSWVWGVISLAAVALHIFLFGYILQDSSCNSKLLLAYGQNIGYRPSVVATAHTEFVGVSLGYVPILHSKVHREINTTVFPHFFEPIRDSEQLAISLISNVIRIAD